MGFAIFSHVFEKKKKNTEGIHEILIQKKREFSKCSMWYLTLHSVRSHFSKLPCYVNFQIYPKHSTPHLKKGPGFAALALFTCFSVLKDTFYYLMPSPQSGFPLLSQQSLFAAHFFGSGSELGPHIRRAFQMSSFASSHSPPAILSLPLI